MDHDDPWDWSTDRVVCEFCTSNRSWPLRSASMAIPNSALLESLAKALREQEITGDTLLMDVDSTVMQNSLGLRTVGQRAFVQCGINALRLRSTGYQAYIKANKPENTAGSKAIRLLHDFCEVIETIRGAVPGLLHGQPRQTHSIANVDQLPLQPVNYTSLTHSDIARLRDVDDEDQNAKRRRLDTAVPVNSGAPLFADGGNLLDNPHGEHGILTPDLERSSDLALDSGKKRKRIAPTLITSEIDPDRCRGIPSAADVINLNHFSSRDNISDVTEVVGQNPATEHGVPFVDNNGRRRVVPLLEVYHSNPSRPGLEVQSSPTLNNAASPRLSIKSKNSGRSKAKTVVPSYLGRSKMAAENFFYPETAIGKDLPEQSNPVEFSSLSKGITNGQRLYAHGLMKRFLLSPSQHFVRGAEAFSAVIPYSKKLVSRFQKQSFTLYYTHDDGMVRARREEVASWPELDDGAASITQVTAMNSYSSVFNPTGPGILDNVGGYEESFDLSYLENKYKYLKDGDDVLTIYGHSDEENEYDAATWKEIEEERGEKLDRPLRQTTRSQISSQEVSEAIDRGITQLAEEWINKKLPKQKMRGFRLWKKSRKEHDECVRIAAAHADLQNINRRISNMRKEILDDIWTSKAQVLRQVSIMEVDVFTREELNWKIRLLKQNVCPEKPLRTSLGTTPKKLNAPLDVKQGESIESERDTSSSDDSLDDFVVADELLPTPEQEFHELDLADAEDEANGKSVETTHSQECAVTHGNPVLSEIRSFPSSTTEIRMPIQGNDRNQTSLATPIDRQEVQFYDLTMISSDESSTGRPNKINLVTPQKMKSKLKRLRQKNSSSPVILVVDSDSDPMPDLDDLPPLHDPAAIAKLGYIVWARLLDKERLLVTVFFKMDKSMREDVLQFVSNKSELNLWNALKPVIDAYANFYEAPEDTVDPAFKGVKGIDRLTFDILSGLILLFEIYIDCCYHHWRAPPSKFTISKVIGQKDNQFSPFYKLCVIFDGIFIQKPAHISSSTVPKKDRVSAGRNASVIDLSHTVNAKDDKGNDEHEDEDEDAHLPVKRRARDIEANDDEALEEVTISLRKRVKPIKENIETQLIQRKAQARYIEQKERAKMLQARLAQHGLANDERQGRIIVNNAAGEHDSYHYITHHIASRIKKHQVEGVRFMWNQIVTGVNDEAMQGCLLAHTMGLGKTMQVITLLVAIAEAAVSEDPHISSQIPEKLRMSRTLVLCPPGLIDNWMDELLTWVPGDILGPLNKITATLTLPERLNKIQEWNDNGGVLIVGYDMFRNIILNKKKKNIEFAPLTEAEHNLVEKHLLEGPNIIVADEAHKMKNAAAGITIAASRFRSTSRIALTGSPLANNVEEYHTMIDWIAPKYLGPVVEFRAKYVEPIQEGLWQNSTRAEYRRALKMLGALKETLTPKVNRADMSVLRNDLPAKKEFVITVPLTELQKKVYSLYVRIATSSSTVSTTESGAITQTTLWHWLTMLSLICNHPKCFDSKIHDRKVEARKDGGEIPSSPQDNTEDILDINAPAWKIGVSKELISATTELFQKDVPDLNSIDLSYKVQILCQILDASKMAGDQCLVFSQSIPTLNFLEQLCKTQGRLYARLDGKTKMDKRQGMSKKFNKGSIDLFIISTAAGALGLNLFGANRVIIFDFKFNPTMEEQAVGRAYRIGQRKPTFVYRFVAGGTFESHIHNKTVFKMQLASRVVDKKKPIAYATRRFNEFLFDPKDVEQKDLSEFKGMDPLVLDKVLDSQTRLSTIRNIVQTDTFERDAEDDLTPEEQREAKAIADDDALKRTDPAKWHSLQLERYQQAMQQIQQQAQQQIQPHAQKKHVQQQEQQPQPGQPQQQAEQRRQLASHEPISTLKTSQRPHQQHDDSPVRPNDSSAHNIVRLPAQFQGLNGQVSAIHKRPDIVKQSPQPPIEQLVNSTVSMPTDIVAPEKSNNHSATKSPQPSVKNLPTQIDQSTADLATSVVSSEQTKGPNPNSKKLLKEASPMNDKDNGKNLIAKVRNILHDVAIRMPLVELLGPNETVEKTTRRIRSKVELMIPKKNRSERIDAMRIISTRLSNSVETCRDLLTCNLSVDDFVYDIVKPTQKEGQIGASKENGKDITTSKTLARRLED